MLFLVERIPQEAELAWQGNTAGHLKCAWMTAGVLETTTKQQLKFCEGDIISLWFVFSELKSCWCPCSETLCKLNNSVGVLRKVFHGVFHNPFRK